MAQDPRSTFTDEIAATICEAIAEGDALTTICNVHGLSYYTVIGWLRKHPEFAQNYARAREDQADYDADRIGQIAARTLLPDTDPDYLDAAQARVAIDAYKWSAGKRHPKRYGDRQFVDVTATVETMDRTALASEIRTLAEKLGLPAPDLDKALD